MRNEAQDVSQNLGSGSQKKSSLMFISQDIVSPLLLGSIRTIGSLIVLGIPIICSISFLAPLRSFAANILPDMAPLSSLVPPRPPNPAQRAAAKSYRSKVWIQIILVVLGLAEAAIWMSVLGSEVITSARAERTRDILLALGMVFVWVRS